MAWKLSPSDFAFLWEQCKRCFYIKVIHGIRQPSMPMAGIFKRIENLQQSFYDGKHTREVLPHLPAGTIRCGEKWVESREIKPPGHENGCYVSGKLDSLIEFEDGSWGVVDFKTTEPTESKAGTYSRQLHAYAFGLENPSPTPRNGETLALNPISKLGLLVFEPSQLNVREPGRQSYEGNVSWVEIPRNDIAFLQFVTEVLNLLSGPMPGRTVGCAWCEYVVKAPGVDSTAAPRMPSVPSPSRPPSGSQDACPKCGAPMIQRNGSRGPFLGCTRYPECRGTRNLSVAR